MRNGEFFVGYYFYWFNVIVCKISKDLCEWVFWNCILEELYIMFYRYIKLINRYVMLYIFIFLYLFFKYGIINVVII